MLRGTYRYYKCAMRAIGGWFAAQTFLLLLSLSEERSL